MIVFPNCKINLGLHILKKRADGYHEIETIFYPLRFTDALEIIATDLYAKETGFPFSSSGLNVPGKPASNLCAKAYRLLKKDFPELPGVHIHLHKVIPAGAGLGGGSADAAFSLLLLNKLFNLSLTREQLIHYAGELGSDCPFFVINKPCIARGRGEKLEEVDLKLSRYKIVLVNPGIHIDTGRAFLNIRPSIPKKNLLQIINAGPEIWKDELTNDFEPVIFQQHPAIAQLKTNLYEQGAVYAAMSGTGSSVFGIFYKEKPVSLDFPSNYFSKEILN